MKKTIKTILTLNLIVLTLSFRAEAESSEEHVLNRLTSQELTFFGIDADVRRLLFDPQFERDVRHWWKAINSEYIKQAESGEYFGEAYLGGDEVRKWAYENNLRELHRTHRRLRELFADEMGNAVPSEKVQIFLAYFLQTKQKQKAKSLLKIYLVQYGLFGQEILQDPRSRHRYKSKTIDQLKKIAEFASPTQAPIKPYADCVDLYTGVESVPSLARCMKKAVRNLFWMEAQGNFKGGNFAANLDYLGPQHRVSSTGFIAGTSVKLFTENRHDPKIINYFENIYKNKENPVAKVAKKYSVKKLVTKVRAYIKAIQTNPKAKLEPFTTAAFFPAEDHPAFEYSKDFDPDEAIFPEVYRAIKNAKHTIYINVFFLGGTMGVAIAQELIKAAELRDVKVFVMKDPYNSFDYQKEMDPVFKTLQAYERIAPEKMLVAGSFIFGHRTGLPRYFDAVVPDALVDSMILSGQELLSRRPPLFPKAKSDHSKVMIIDGAGLWKDSTPIAYVGSKNWTDSSGAMTYDEMLRMRGPAAVLLQDSYYWDFFYALRAGGPGRKPMQSQDIETALNLFDPLARRWDPSQGKVIVSRKKLANVNDLASNTPPDVVLRIGQNNIDSSELSSLDQNIYLIRNAKKQIIINDQYFYDRRIVEELMEVARTKPEVQIYILLEPISKSSGLDPSDLLGGFPNTLYADLLKYKQIRLDSTTGQPAELSEWKNIHLKWKFIPPSEKFRLEFHLKSLSVDGFASDGTRVNGVGNAPAALITGSANKDQMTMSGAFRESQVEVYDSRLASAGGVVAQSDATFWKRWNADFLSNPTDGSVQLDPFNFEVPQMVQKFARKALGRDMTPAEFLVFSRSVIHTAYDLETQSCIE